jgi:hypothetical protein
MGIRCMSDDPPKKTLHSHPLVKRKIIASEQGLFNGSKSQWRFLTDSFCDGRGGFHQILQRYHTINQADFIAPVGFALSKLKTEGVRLHPDMM